MIPPFRLGFSTLAQEVTLDTLPVLHHGIVSYANRFLHSDIYQKTKEKSMQAIRFASIHHKQGASCSHP